MRTIDRLNFISQDWHSFDFLKIDQLYMRQTADQMLKERNATDELVTRMEAAEKQFIQSVAQMKALVISSVREELGGQVAQAVNR